MKYESRHFPTLTFTRSFNSQASLRRARPAARTLNELEPLVHLKISLDAILKAAMIYFVGTCLRELVAAQDWLRKVSTHRCSLRVMKCRCAGLKVLHSLLGLHGWNGRIGGRFWHRIKNTTASTKYKVTKCWTWKWENQIFLHPLTSLFSSQKISRVWTSSYHRNGRWTEEKVNIEKTINADVVLIESPVCVDGIH